MLDVQDSQQQVGNGRAYAVCSCDGNESETSDKCGFRTEDRAKMAVACDEGYAVKVWLSHNSPILTVSNCLLHLSACPVVADLESWFLVSLDLEPCVHHCNVNTHPYTHPVLGCPDMMQFAITVLTLDQCHVSMTFGR